MRERLSIEIEWLLFMAEHEEIGLRRLSSEEIQRIQQIVETFDEASALRVKEIEEETKHDIKALEYYLREQLARLKLEDIVEFVHFCCTSEDISNLAYGRILKAGVHNHWIPKAQQLIESVTQLARACRETPMLSHTHGQAASPTTFGKEMNYVDFAYDFHWQP